MENSINIFVQMIVLVGGIFTGLFALVKYFLKHLDRKDDRTERIAENFNKTVINHLAHSQEAQTKLTSSNEVLAKVLEKLIQKL